MTSREIVQRLLDYTLDAGITYLEHEPPTGVLSVALYEERPMFVTRTSPSLDADGRIALRAALDHDLCLLHPGMQNRRILDANLAARDLTVRPRVTADSYVSLLALISTGRLATIMPDSYGALLPAWARMIPFADPLPASAIGMIVPDRTPLNPLAAAALTTAKKMTVDDSR
jgi:DNA-binding transcriptional LysR family regulator